LHGDDDDDGEACWEICDPEKTVLPLWLVCIGSLLTKACFIAHAAVGTVYLYLIV